ncbi:hypothetical protein ZWY2020_035737 [Hordeum vulgare]|nr:hypothetical protein ZWY2020_035737 [Hordeum vulgare]
MQVAVACSVKCRPHHRLSVPQLPAVLEILPRGTPASAGELRATRCWTPPSLSFARASDQGEPPVPPTESIWSSIVVTVGKSGKEDK